MNKISQINDTRVVDFLSRKNDKDSIANLIISVDRLLQLLQNSWVPPHGKDESFYYGWEAAFQRIRDSSATESVFEQINKIHRKDTRTPKYDQV